ncbi:MAG: hypothetical protein Q8P51_07820 [Ignavibacteria bacterium]|nr:hypothetical protein [Ignavibacteria bacterium]
MKLLKKILCIWISILALMTFSMMYLPNGGASNGDLILQALMVLGAIVSLNTSLRETSPSNRAIFFNFALLFFVSAGSFLFAFVGYGIFPGDRWMQFFAPQYVTLAYFFLLSLAIVFVVIDSLLNDLRTYSKYITTLLIVAGAFMYYNYPFFQNPKYSYSTEDVVDYKAIDGSMELLSELGKPAPTNEEIAAITSLGAWKGGIQVGTLFEDQKVRRVSELLPYLRTENGHVPLIWKPLYLNNIYISVLCVVFIFLFFGYQYRNDPPQGAYIEKIIFLFLPYCSLEILHHYAYIKSVEYATLIDVQQVGYYLTLLNLLLLLVFFGLRLRFITSVKGEFYERELVSDSEHISRWRDAFDNLVVRHFLNPKAIHGRLFAPRTPRNKA